MTRFGRWLARLLRLDWPLGLGWPQPDRTTELQRSAVGRSLAAGRRDWWSGLAGLASQAGLTVSGAVLLELFVQLVTGQGLTTASTGIGALALVVAAFSAGWLWYRGTQSTPLDTPQRPGPPPEALPHVSGFVGRHAQLGAVVEFADREPVIAVVGERGAGTSAFVLHAAHLLQPRYPDGQVYIDVRGSERRRLKPGRVLDQVCRALRLPPPRSWRSSDLEAASNTLQSALARKRVLLVLDNVDDPAQVALVLPKSTNSLALFAGSDTMDLNQVRMINIGALSTDEAVALLALIAGRDLVGRDRESAKELVRLFARQPLAIRLLGQQLVKHGLAVDELRRQMARLTGEPRYEHEPDAPALRELWNTCDLTYQHLDPAQQKMFRLLGLVPGNEIGVSAAAALAGLRVTRARRAMEGLAAHGLLELESDGRYRLRKLLAGSARLHLKDETPEGEDRALLGLTQHLGRTAVRHAKALVPAVGHRADEREAARVAAREWFLSEHDLLFRLLTNWHSDDAAHDGAAATAEQPPGPVQPWLHRMAVALCVWYAEEGRLTEWQEVCRAVLAMPLAGTDLLVAAWAHNELGAVYRRQGDPLAAGDELVKALRHSPRRRSQAAQIHTNLGLTWLDRSARHDRTESREAMLHIDRARRLSGEPYGRAIQHLALSGIYLQSRDSEAALHHIEQCLDLFDELDDPRGMAAALDNFGLALWLRGDHAGAEEYWEQAIERHTRLGDSAGIARVRLNLAAMLLAVDPARTDEAVELLQESLQWRAGSPETLGTGLCHLHLGDAYAQKQDLDKACEAWSRARTIFDELDAVTVREEAVQRLARHQCRQ